MPEENEYLRFLAERGMTEADVYPMLGDRKILERPENRSLLEDYMIATAKQGKEEDIAVANQLIESLSPGANANKLIRLLDQRLHEYLYQIGIQLPAGVLATGVYPLNYFRAQAVSRQNGVLLLFQTGSIEFLEYVVSLSLMPEPPSQTEKIELLSKAVREFTSSSPPRLPILKELDGPSWNSVKWSVYQGVTWAEWFLLCHEYAHHALGHLKNAQAERYTDRHGKFEIVQYSHIQEYEADLWALTILIRLISAGAPPLPPEIGIAFACAAPFFYLGLLEVMDKDRKTVSPRYPSAAARIMNLELFSKSCELNARPYQYLWWTFNELLEDVSQHLVGCNLITPEQRDKGLLRDLAHIITRMRPILSGIEQSKPTRFVK